MNDALAMDFAMKDVAECAGAAERLFEVVLSKIGSDKDMEGRLGGYLCIADRTGLPVLVVRLGEMSTAKATQYFRNALEKALRLALISGRCGDTLSRHSRDETRERWAGAVLGDEYVWSFSGLPEDADEMFVILLAHTEYDLSLYDASLLAGSNRYFEGLTDLFEPADVAKLPGRPPPV